MYQGNASQHHLSLLISGLSLKSIRNYATLTDVNIRPGSHGARSSWWPGQNITRNTRWPGPGALLRRPNFHPFVSFLCICQKDKNILRQTLAEHIPWELITPGDVRNSSSLNTHSALVGNSFWDYVIMGIVLGSPCHWYNAATDIPGHIWILWNALTLPPPPPQSPLSPLSAQSRPWCPSCPSITLSAPISPGCVYFLSLFSGLCILSRASVFSVSEPQICSAVDTGPSVSALSTQKWLLACSCLGLCVTVLIRPRSWDSNPPVSPGYPWSSLSEFLSPHRSNPGRVGLDMDAPAASPHCYSDEGMMEAKGSSPLQGCSNLARSEERGRMYWQAGD